MTMRRACSLLVLATGLGLAAAGCIAADDAAGDDTVGEVEQAVSGACPKWGCGANSPVIDNYGLHELNEQGQLNSDGFYIVKATHPAYVGRSFKVNVSGGKLFARANGLPALTLGGAGVKNLVIQIKGPGGTLYDVRVTDTGTTPYWSTLYPGTATTYRLDWKQTGVGDYRYTNVCSNPPHDTGEDTLGMNPFWVVLFEGDRINADKKLVYADGSTSAANNDWFNIGCAGHALAKLHLNRHTQSSRPAGDSVDLGERTTFIKMVTADYCGDGTPFTFAGEPLVWKDDRNWLSFYVPPAAGSVEARWSKDGATCLEEPRLLNSTNPQVPVVFPDIELAIKNQCARPPKCTAIGEDADPNKLYGKHLVSANH